jgi:NAD(P)-dependent dehydrogenase (short-subunit alcohol dehydrogenase family)
MSLDGKVAVITGGGQGIGKAIARAFLERSCSAVIADRDSEAGEEAAEELGRLGRTSFIPADVSSAHEVEELVRLTLERFGRLDVLVNNAGISINRPLELLSLEEWNRVLGVNLTGPFLCSRQAAPHLRQQGGCIINIASTRAFMSEADTEAYSASKGGIEALTHAMAVSLGPEVRVNCISPGWIETGNWKKRSQRRIPELSAEDHLQHPAGRVGQPEDVAHLAIFLASPEASFITGANFIVDGGMTRKMIYL